MPFFQKILDKYTIVHYIYTEHLNRHICCLLLEKRFTVN